MVKYIYNHAIKYGETMSTLDNRIAEAFERLLGSNEALGITKGKPEIDEPNRMPRQYEYIRGLFGLKVADSTFYESLCSAFYDIHSYRYVDDPLFCESLTTRLKAIGTPQDEICKACNAVMEINKDMHKEYGLKENEAWSEKAAGWHPNIAGIIATSQDFNKDGKKEEPYSGGGPWPIEESIMKLNGNIIENICKKYKLISEDINGEAEEIIRDELGESPTVLLIKRLAINIMKARKMGVESKLTHSDVTRAINEVVAKAQQKGLDQAVIAHIKNDLNSIVSDRVKLGEYIRAASEFIRASTEGEMNKLVTPQGKMPEYS
jgi:hypothetical protein